MECLRTPDERFDGLPDWPWAPRAVELDDGEGGRLRMAYADVGPADVAPPDADPAAAGDRAGALPRAASGRGPILCLHGQPTWSYLYRKLIPIFAGAGHRVVAPDLVGYGRSDKPTRIEDHDYARHVAWMRGFVEALDLREITLVCQDWGGLIGLRVVAEAPERFARVVASNTALPDAQDVPADAAPALRALYAKLPVPQTMAEVAAGFVTGPATGTPPFMHWQKHCAESTRFTPRDVMAAMCPGLSDAELAAYAAPFPDERFLAGPRRLPSLVPILPDDVAVADNRRAWAALARFEKPFLTAFTDGDPVTRGMHVRFQTDVPGARAMPHATIRGAGHFVQEDAGEALARITLDLVARTP
ncbi:MAG: haloalkane dehalogenase [Myxococcota bacterium]